MNVQRYKTIAAKALALLGSSQLALFLVAMVILFCLTAAMVPQEGQFLPSDISQWQNKHPLLTSLFHPPGFFKIFHSTPFLLTIFLLAVNTLTCTLIRFFRLIHDQGFNAFRGLYGLRHIGFLILHLSLILLFTGGALSAAFSLDGYIILTEGQWLPEKHTSYVRLVEGPLRGEKHTGFSLLLKKAWEEYQNGYLVDRGALVTLEDNSNQLKSSLIQINNPLIYQKKHITLDKVGYSPHIRIENRSNTEKLVDSFVALKIFDYGDSRVHSDFLPLPIFDEQQQKMYLKIYPASETNNNTSLLRVELEDNLLKKSQHAEIQLANKIALGEYEIEFKGLRQWASFRIMEDPGYGLVCLALWLGTFGVVVRYIPDLKKWFSKSG